MKGKVVVAPLHAELEGPVIFLAGPMLGANWRREAIAILVGLAPGIHVASPERDSFHEDINFLEQVNWETHYLRRAGRNGVVMFWLAKEKEHRCERAFAQTTRFELGEWKMRHEREGARVVVGIEEGFSNARYIRLRLQQDCPGIPVCASLEDTCKAAVNLIRAGSAQPQNHTETQLAGGAG
jgi:hypothetical protein